MPASYVVLCPDHRTACPSPTAIAVTRPLPAAFRGLLGSQSVGYAHTPSLLLDGWACAFDPAEDAIGCSHNPVSELLGIPSPHGGLVCGDIVIARIEPSSPSSRLGGSTLTDALELIYWLNFLRAARQPGQQVTV